jgi:hypothetical protein
MTTVAETQPGLARPGPRRAPSIDVTLPAGEPALAAPD